MVTLYFGFSPVTNLVTCRLRGVSSQVDTHSEEDEIMQARIKNPALAVPGVLDAFQQLAAAVATAGVPEATLYMVELRASQINGCSVCVDIHSRELAHSGEKPERIAMVAAWREAPYFSDAERAALALTEAATRLADHPESVTDEIWDEAARHYSEPQLAALVVTIATINAFNRLNATTRQITGAFVDQIARASARAAA
jgi:AhpD family alkylhydroperoxidase